MTNDFNPFADGPQQPTVTMPNEIEAAESGADERLSDSWPERGYTGSQPWQVQEPPALSHDRGLLIVGSAGDDVYEVAAALARLGYPTSISRGENPQNLFTEAEREAVNSFRRDYGIEEDPALTKASTPDVVGPWTWEALFRLVEQQAIEAEAEAQPV